MMMRISTMAKVALLCGSGLWTVSAMAQGAPADAPAAE